MGNGVTETMSLHNPSQETTGCPAVSFETGGRGQSSLKSPQLDSQLKEMENCEGPPPTVLRSLMAPAEEAAAPPTAPKVGDLTGSHQTTGTPATFHAPLCFWSSAKPVLWE